MSTVEKLSLENFRNLSTQIVSFKPKVNCIFGENGNGKTNILEAIYFSINKKSFRKKAGFQQILSIDCGKPEILSKIVIKNDHFKDDFYSILWKTDKYICLKNGHNKIRKPNSSCIFVSPFDSFHFHNESSYRRNLVDLLISNFDLEYKKCLSDYNKALKQKNQLLKYIKDKRQLSAINNVIADKIEVLAKKRNEFVCQINPILSKIYKEIFSEDIQLELEIISQFIGLNNVQIIEKLNSNQQIDIDLGYSKIGSHKDEISLKFNGFNSIDFCSLGQQKTAYLSLLFAYINLFRYKFNVFPIVLIDDVSGELDSTRLDLLISYLFKAEYQVILTTANKDFKNKLRVFGNINLVEVKDGYFH